jgi:hypothetical protein
MKNLTTKQIISRLLRLGITQEQIAAASGLTQGRISQIHVSPDDAKASCSYENGKLLENFLREQEAQASESSQ